MSNKSAMSFSYSKQACYSTPLSVSNMKSHCFYSVKAIVSAGFVFPVSGDTWCLNISCSLPLLKHRAHYSFTFINSHNSAGEGGNRKRFSPEVYCLKRVQFFPSIRASAKQRGIWARPRKKYLCRARFSLFLSESLSLMTLANVKWGVNVSAVLGLQRNPLIIYPGYPTLELEARSPLAFMPFSVKK